MGIPVLVVDSNVDNGKLIKKNLEADQHFQVTLATRAIEALMRFTETRYRVAVVDFGLLDLDGIGLIRQIRGIDENIIIVAVLENMDSRPKDIEKLAINIILDKPAYLTDLPQKLVQLLKIPSLKPAAASTKKPMKELHARQDDQAPKMADRDKAAPSGPLVEESAKPEAPAVKTPGEELPIEQTSTEEPAQIEIAQDIATEIEAIQDETPSEEEIAKEEPHLKIPQAEPSQDTESRDETTPIPPWLKEPASVEKSMDSLRQEHSAYATLLSIGNTPWTYSEQLSENQAHGIVRLLSEHDEGLQSKGALIRYIRLSGTGNDYLLYATPVIGDINLSMIFSMDTPFSVARRQTHRISRLLVEQDPKKIAGKEEKPIIEKLVSVSQVEDEALLPSDWIPGPKVSTKEVEPSAPPPAPEVVEEYSESTPAQTVVEEPSAPAPAPATAEKPSRERVMAPSFTAAPEITPIPNDWLPKEPKPTSHLPFLEQTAQEPEKSVELEPINLAQQEPKYYLPFTAILLPRFPNHRLAGSLANQLENWLKELCIAWGWRIDHIDLRSEYLRFTVNLSPDIAPAQAVQHLANNLSSKILNAFPGLMSDLPSGQFWTKSYLLTAGSDVGKDRLALFIETTRREQGLVN